MTKQINEGGNKLSKSMESYRNQLIRKHFPGTIIEGGKVTWLQRLLFKEVEELKWAEIDRLVRKKEEERKKAKEKRQNKKDGIDLPNE